jgi:hypothetical protein
MELNVQLRASDGDPLSDPTHYHHLVRSLVYLVVTHPDISYPVYILSQFSLAPTTAHYSYLLRVLRYLHGTITRHLFFPRSSSLQLQAYSDATWASDPMDRRLLSTYCVFLGGSPIAWKTKKQTAVSRSSVEANTTPWTKPKGSFPTGKRHLRGQYNCRQSFSPAIQPARQNPAGKSLS